MYAKGDYIFHENNGVCRVEDISEIAMAGRGSEKLYYTLLPNLEKKSVVYTLVESPRSKVRDIMTEEQLKELLDTIPDIEIKWEKNDKIRIQYYKDSVTSADPSKLLEVLKTVYYGNQMRIKAGKKILTADDRYYQIAGKKLFDEISFVFHLDMKEAEKMVEDALRDCME